MTDKLEERGMISLMSRYSVAESAERIINCTPSKRITKDDQLCGSQGEANLLCFPALINYGKEW